MTWFRVGGAGIPATLKNAMNSVLNKKFGTSGQNYPPKQWPDDVNLLGPLPEKTASGAIATFSDGADDVPIKSCAVTIAPTLDGVSSVGVVSAGKNLVNIPDSTEITRNQLNSNVVPLLDDFLNGKKGNFTISAKTAETVENANFITIRINYTDGTSSSNVYIYRGSTHESGGITGTFSISSDPTKTIDSVSFGGNTGAAKCAVSEWQVEANSQATTYEPYAAPTTHTASLGRTIHGGQADIVNGTGTENEKGKWLSELSWTQNATFPHVFNGTGFTDRKKSINWNNATCLSDRYTGYTSSEVGTKSEGIALGTGATNTTIYVSDDRFETVAEFTASLETDDSFVVLPLETPTDFTFTGQEVPTRLGYNAFWNDDGDTEVTYRRDIDLALQAVSNNRGLIMASRPVTQLVGEESDPDQVNELVENDETEQEGEDNAR